MSKTTAHIINHTHWDREWFLTSVYTSRWIPGLIDKLDELVAENPDFHYLLDGQTLVIEDLVALAPEYEERTQALIHKGNLTVGPYYCQPDWQLTGGELLIRNLVYGQRDVATNGGQMLTGWMVDTFGHLSQSPQIHQLFGIEAIYVWRGVPRLEPYFNWQGADGTQLFTIDLFGGYRNLYGVTHVPEIGVKRLVTETGRLLPYYPTPDIPLFDGYDLEDDPEDPVRFYAGQEGLPADLAVLASTPSTFATQIEEVMAEKLSDLPTLTGELNSGKYGATFPGVYSARTYLKIMASDCERLLFQRCEPLATMAHLQGRAYNAERYESTGRLLLQNAVHDCICGVSIDQVHEKMAYGYRQAFNMLVDDVQESLSAILSDFAADEYAVSTTPFVVDQWQPAGDRMVYVKTDGVGVWPVSESTPIEHVDEVMTSFSWANDHDAAEVDGDGQVRVNGALLGQWVVSEEKGDTYSEEIGDALGDIRTTSPLTVAERSEQHAVVAFDGEWRAEERWVSVAVHLHFGDSPLIRWTIDLDSRGTDLRVDMVFETRKQGDIFAGMPFDVVQRAAVDDDLLPRDLPGDLADIMLGQRELGAVSTFPFHDFVARSDAGGTVAVLSKGTHAYSADGQGTLKLALRRSVEWLTVADLKDRVGDAGPFLYVPDARCERRVRHEVAVAFGDFAGDSIAMQQLNATYQNPPLIVANQGDGGRTSWQLLSEEMPLSSLQVCDDEVLARFHNPTSSVQPLSGVYQQTDVWGIKTGVIEAVAPKRIETVRLSHSLPKTGPSEGSADLVPRPQWRVGDNQGMPDPAILDDLQARIAGLEAEIAILEPTLDEADEGKRLRLQHRYYVLKRESVEFQLSHLLNRRKLAEGGKLRYGYLYEPDDEIAEIGLELNKLRIKRRIFDYVVTAI